MKLDWCGEWVSNPTSRGDIIRHIPLFFYLSIFEYIADIWALLTLSLLIVTQNESGKKKRGLPAKPAHIKPTKKRTSEHVNWQIRYKTIKVIHYWFMSWNIEKLKRVIEDMDQSSRET